jgi:hypothetical protein
MWIYFRGTGELVRNGVVAGAGYAGCGEGLNNPAMSNVPDVGPLPAGDYTIGKFGAHPDVGLFAAPLQVDARNEMFGRDGFFLHGDNEEMNHTASEGCIVMAREIREAVAASGDTLLRVL